VSDTGIGIADADMPKLFSRFSQVDGSLARRHEGVGLGLAVCRQLVELMGGEISVTSAPGRGSSFRFWVPASQAQEEAGRDNSFDDSVDLLPIRLLRILVAEDHPTNQKLIEALLVSMGHEAVIVANGAEAIAAIQQGEFDLVLMDVQMPVMDGVTAVRAIRKLAPPHCGIPVIALTANAMNDYVAKPIERRLLEEAIDRCSVGLVRTLPAEADRVSGRRLAV
jgi:CheY-like chemotaxis protein